VAGHYPNRPSNQKQQSKNLQNRRSHPTTRLEHCFEFQLTAGLGALTEDKYSFRHYSYQPG